MKALLFATVALCAVSIPVQAAIVRPSSVIRYDDPDGRADIRIASFDPALGNLDAVNLLIQGFVSRNIQIRTFSPAPNPLTVNLVSFINLASDTFRFALPQAVFPYDQDRGGM